MFKSKKGLYIMTTSLPLTYGGRTRSLLQRSRILTENGCGIDDITLITTNYNPDYEYVYKQYRNKAVVNENTDFLNMYNDLRWDDSVNIRNNYREYLHKELGDQYFAVPKKGNEHKTVFYKNGVPILHTSYNTKTNRMGHIEVYSNQHSHPAKRIYIDKNGNLHRIRYFKDKTKDNVIRDVFVDRKFNAYLTKEYIYTNETLKLDRIILFKKDNSSEVFLNEKELIKYWFEGFLVDGDTVINDVRHLDRPLLNVNKNIKRIFQMHGPHLSKPNNLDSETKNSFRYLFENISEDQDVIISLTNGQRENIIKKYPHLANRIYVIPHCISGKVNINEKMIDRNKICVVSRLVELKRIDHAIKAFNSVLKDRPNIKLEIYGEGEEEESLKRLVAELGIQDSVKFKGFTKNPQKIYESSSLFLMTSKLEGFGLTVLESIFHGCPVVSYDITWGPSEIINDNNGILVENGDINGLKNAMVTLLDSPPKRKKVAKLDEKFTQKHFVKSWKEILRK
ncbi:MULTISPECIES: glycosyltransferase [Virgibacillus]|uniref:Glycosyl transferase family 1 domain-containing protein n=2 Tax=Bacillaceae TaxID=186817 RepID=A0A0L0QSN4_VIRPA|nr:MULTISPECIES: glycosyltransferase [Virgibacillus]API91758.1 hypothetical protein BKP57_07905 [Virgibacillus sp. 6R]KNE21601.1 hypothetical protein AFK71_08120 [Virgibacillus pantothenticus]MBS7427879.1 glycosyltransferase [Virgibacillus sp. 19R1-5]SIS74069.1 poly(glycerol-phosphate) alpha-glucosyltransferase [Virgibacillus pantothenticus]